MSLHRWSTVRRTINEACDEIIEAGDFADTGTEVALCLLVNATMSYLEHSALDLDAVARNDYEGVDLRTLLDWIDGGPPREDDDLMALADAVGVNRTPSGSAERVNSDVAGPPLVEAVEPISTGDSATDVPTTLHLVQPGSLEDIPRYTRKHRPQCAVWIGLDCTCEQLRSMEEEGGDTDG